MNCGSIQGVRGNSLLPETGIYSRQQIFPYMSQFSFTYIYVSDLCSKLQGPSLSGRWSKIYLANFNSYNPIFKTSYEIDVMINYIHSLQHKQTRNL